MYIYSKPAIPSFNFQQRFVCLFVFNFLLLPKSKMQIHSFHFIVSQSNAKKVVQTHVRSYKHQGILIILTLFYEKPH